MVTIATWEGDDNYVVKMAIKRSDMASLWSSLHGWQLQVWVQEEGLPNPLCRGAFAGGGIQGSLVIFQNLLALKICPGGLLQQPSTFMYT